ncbi:unnamed protein product [Rangifer tarandus platyrhynchus]|uniref:Uncharacterized protein n=2 Tax=Rangifer tarandus platyrhynchus TaxID=3082113 RepID=A0ABN8Z8G7_RANTA|nr:unnamed protein product [Rangifer tarandus platyrhynchus]CAI9704545.1 unnamed protein product [Rangifer tarandus platyrhynchus]
MVPAPPAAEGIGTGPVRPGDGKLAGGVSRRDPSLASPSWRDSRCPADLFRERAGFCEGGEAAGRRLWQKHRKHSWLILFPTGDGAGAAQDTGDAASALEKLTVFLKRQV